MIDQRRLPGELKYVTCRTSSQVAEAIRNMTIRGAPAIGVAAAFGLALTAARGHSGNIEEFKREISRDSKELLAARPTAINLAYAVKRMNALLAKDLPVDELRAAMIEEASRIAEEDVQTNLCMAKIGAELIEDGDAIIHHCNTGALAVVDWGTALGCIRMAHEQGKKITVLVDETRPRLQGARLTAWELEQYGIPYKVIVDGAAGSFLRNGKATRVMFGADRVAANGDIANKIGTYMLALAAHENKVPVIPVFPCTSVDLSLKSGDQIPIEERDTEEVLGIEIKGKRVTPKNARALNPAFDITPAKYISKMVTDRGIVEPPFEVNLKKVVESECREQ